MIQTVELAQQPGTIGAVGTVVSSVTAVLAVVLMAASWVVKRQGREARDARLLRQTNLAALRWYYRVSAVAAVNGWDTHPAWPDTPKELTAEFLAGQAQQQQADPGSALALLADAAESMRKGGAS